MNASVKRLFLLLLLLLTIPSCGQVQTKPSLEPKPPLIDCKERRRVDPPPPPPLGTDYRLWTDAYVKALGWGTQQVDYRADTADCLDKHRAKGDIR